MRRVGIVGGGQLGRMLIQAGIDLDLRLRVLDGAADSPCSGIAHEFVLGSVRSATDLYEFGKDLEIVTIELEEVSVEGLRLLQGRGIHVAPAPAIVELIQDKGTQRQWYAQHGFPCPRFQLWTPGMPIELSFPLVQKARRGGYDGRGVQIAHTPSDLWPVPSVLEEYLPILKEVSVIAARNRAGEVRTFPPVESVFHPQAHIVTHLKIPADLPPDLAQEAQQLAAHLAETLRIEGLLAVELFLTTDSQWYLNEAAPRPHNTGHITVKACWTSQFEQHWRAILNLPLGETRLHTPGALVNILGPAGANGTPRFPFLEAILRLPGVSVHLYGKRKSTPFRKLGHVLLLAPDPPTLQKHLAQVQSLLQVEVEEETTQG
ncbi:MAG: 5-(carboxyamino)imidazole ribonucleotide synthase [Bacteroidia bacterium]|nr:5-(carboxyamino)imidazole ribonucleotide synthase [Bacteroidia bacterium]MDW8088634.1 5-(carboxyamino)imidazole ribonucleotide synthase [Bacteroidia bacterium]